MSFGEKCLAFLVGIILVVLMFLFIMAGGIFEAFVVTKLWGWFVVPTFGLPELSIAVAFGIGMLIALVTNHGNFTKIPGETTSMSKLISYLWFRPAVLLLVGWIVVSYFV